jgi:BRCA1-associated protein
MESRSIQWRLVTHLSIRFLHRHPSFFQPEICHVVHVLSVVIDVEDTVSQTLSRMGSAQANVYELPTCPVCLERMDSAVTGLITVPCSHTFHCMCLSKWGDSRCVFF